MTFTELVNTANLCLTKLGLDRLPDGRLAGQLAARNVRFLRQAGLISNPEGRGPAARWNKLHLQQIITCRAMQANKLSISEIRDRINGLDLDQLQEIEQKALKTWRSKEPPNQDAPCGHSWQITSDFVLVSTRKATLPKGKLEQIRHILSSIEA